jgi:hypothetical protein
MWVLPPGYYQLIWSENADVIGSCDLCYRAATDSIRRDDLVANGTADTFEAAKAAAMFEASTRSPE